MFPGLGIRLAVLSQRSGRLRDRPDDAGGCTNFFTRGGTIVVVIRRWVAGTLMALALPFIFSCNSTSPAAFSDVQVSFATQAAGQQPLLSLNRVGNGLVLYDDTLVSGTDTIIFTEVQLVLRQIELKPVEVESCGESGTSGSDGCQKFEAGPVLVSLPLDGSVKSQFSLDVPPGMYQELEMEIHKVSKDDPEDAAFRTQHPDFIDISIRARGTYIGSTVHTFEFETDLDVEQELNFNPALTVQEGVSTNITVRVGLDTWFTSVSGGLLDPDTGNKGGPNESVIVENIKKSIDAFEDDNRDGER
jgi:hypothetical protein